MNYGLLILLIISACLIIQFFASNDHQVVRIKAKSVIPAKISSELKNQEDNNSKLDFSTIEWENMYQKLTIMDKNFNWSNFSSMVNYNHDKILEYVASGDKKKLMEIISGDLLQNFCIDINDREKKELSQKTEIISSKIVAIENISITGKSKAVFSVRILDKIISFLKDKEENIVHGSKNIVSYNWIWIFVGDIIDNSFKWTVTDIKNAS